jgi:hypothetical protein
MITRVLFLLPWHSVKGTVLDYLGYLKPADPIFAEGFKKGWNPWDDLICGIAVCFWEFLGTESLKLCGFS